MSALDDVIKSIYGNRLSKKDTQGQVHHLYTLYQDSNTHENYFLRTIDFPIHMHISDAIIEVVTKKYGSIISPIKIMPLNRDFQSQNYLVRASQNIILLSNYLQIKRSCSETLDFNLFIRFLEFVVDSYRILESNQLPLFTLSQIGFSDHNQFSLCDVSLYFKNKEHYLGNHSFNKWLTSLIKEFIIFPPGLQSKQEIQQLIRERFGQDISAIYPLIEQLFSEAITPEILRNKINQFGNRISDETTTVTNSFVDINSSLLNRSLKNSFQKVQKSNKINKIGRMAIVFVILTVLLAAGYFCFQFFNRKIVCSEGFFLSDDNQCKNCFDGCLRCSDNAPSKCMRCSVSMYLVLEEEEDSEGFCLKECRGKQINMGVCLKQKQQTSIQINEKQVLDISMKIPLLSNQQIIIM